MKAVPGFPLPEGKCLKLRKSIYGLVQAPRAYYLLCKEVYTKCGMTQLASDECVFIRYVQNIKGAPALTAEDIITRGLFKASDQKIPLEQRVYPDCEFSVASMIICMYVDNNGVRTTSRQLVELHDLEDQEPWDAEASAFSLLSRLRRVCETPSGILAEAD